MLPGKEISWGLPPKNPGARVPRRKLGAWVIFESAIPSSHLPGTPSFDRFLARYRKP